MAGDTEMTWPADACGREIPGLHDPGSATPGLDALERVGARSDQKARRGPALLSTGGDHR